MKRLLILFFLCCSVAQATTRNAVDCTRTAVNTQIGLSAPGDTVIVPAGTCDWTGGLSISGISLIGAGKSTSGTVITAGTVAITKHTTQLTRLSGFRFTGGDQHTAIGGSSSSRAFILDNDYFLFSSQGTLLGISVNGGVIYNCDIISASPTGADMMSISPSEDWSQAVTYGTLDTQGPLGGERNIYFENNNFTNILETVVDGDNGSRIVLRYNNMTDSGIVFHGGGSGGSGNDSSSYGVREFEIYNNQFHRVSNTAALNRWVRVRGGTGVIANNAMDRATSPDGFSYVKPDLVFGVGCSGGAYPRQYQAGQSNSTPENPPSHPILVFGNTGAAISDSNFYSIEANPNVTCSNPSSYIALGRDYVTSNTWGWTPLAYPHPLIAAINGTAIPGLVRWASGSSSNTNAISGGGPASNYTFRLPEGTQAGNSIALCVVSDDTATAPTVTDDKGNSWSLITTSGADASNHMKVRLWLASNVAFGTRTITPAFTPSVSRLAVTGAEFYNLGTADVSGSSVAASSTSMFAGSITPTQAGDLVYMCGARSSVPLVNSATPYTAGSQTNITWNLQATDNWDGLVSQWGVQTVAGTINPQLTMGTASAYVSASMAIRAATAGSALPTGMQVVGIGHYNHASNIAFATVTPKIIQFPTTGNLVVASIGPGGANYSVSSITDSNSNTWSSTGAVLGDANAGKSQRFYTQNATAGNNLRLTANWTGASDNMDSTVLLYDVVGAAASSFTQHYSNYIFGSVGPGSFTAYSNVAPGTSNGIGFAQMSVAFNTICGSNNSVMVAPAAGLCDSYSYGGEPLNGPQPVDQNNGWSHYTFNTNANQTWTWPVQSAGTSLSEIASTLDFFSASPVLPALPVPIFDHYAGAYTTSVNPLVIASRTPGATVCYRIGATPAATVTGTCDAGSTAGTASADGNNQASLVVSSTSTVQALATKAGFTNSAVTSNAYTIVAGCADPVISGLTAVSAANGQSATITWTTDVPSDSMVAYGSYNTGFVTPLTDTAGVTSHSVTINGLRTGTFLAYTVRTRKIVGGIPCGNGYTPVFGNTGSITTATPTGANLTYGISAVGPTYVTQGNKMYFRINLNAKTGAFSSGVKLVLTGLPANTTVGWADPQIFHDSNSVVSTTNAPFTGDTLTMNAGDDCPGQATPYSCNEEPFLITTGSTPTGVANVAITVTATGTCVTNCVQVLTWPVTVVSSSAPFNGVALPQVTPSSFPAIPGQAAYIADAVTFGLQSCPQDVTGTSATRTTYRRNDNTNMLGNGISANTTYGSWFYDGTLGNYNVSTMLETTPSSGGNWAQCVENQKNWYTKVYSPLVQLGIVNEIMTFSSGVFNDYKTTGDQNSLFQVQANINRIFAPYHGGSVDVGALQREVSYALRNSTHGVAAGLDCIPISGAGNCFNVTTTVMRDFMMEHELGQIDQLCLSQNASYYEYFMMGLMAEDLLEYYDVANKDPRIPPAIACLANWMYTNYWQTAQGGTFPYDKASNYFSGTFADSGSCLSTLNNMVAPMFAWLYRYTGDVTWQTEGDEIFYSGTTFRNCGSNNAASIMSFPGDSGGKNYSQNYHWPKYIEWRSAPAFQVFPGSVGFFNIPVSTQSGTRTVTLSNPTTSIVNITSSIAGTGYAITGGTCGASLAAATWLNPSTCTIQLKLTVGATQLATYPGTLTVNGISISLYGTGTSGTVATPTITPSAPGSYAAGTPFLISSPTVGATLCLSDSNDDSLANTFNVPFGSGANGPGGTCTSGHSYPNPTTLTLSTTGFQYIRAVATKANMEDSVAAINQITITASTAPIVSLSQTSLAFITNRTTTSAPQPVTLTNTGTANLTISQISISGLFSQSNNCPIGPPLAPGAFCTFSVTFSPAATGVFNGTLTINDNAAGSPHTVALSGTSTAPVISLLPATYSFGNIALNTTAVSSAFTLQNTGNGPLAVNLSIGGTQPTFFGIFATNCPATLSAGSSCTITVRFSPLTAISYTAALVETDPVATGSPTNNTLIGTGVTPVTPAPVAPLPWIFL